MSHYESKEFFSLFIVRQIMLAGWLYKNFQFFHIILVVKPIVWTSLNFIIFFEYFDGATFEK